MLLHFCLPNKMSKKILFFCSSISTQTQPAVPRKPTRLIQTQTEFDSSLTSSTQTEIRTFVSASCQVQPETFSIGVSCLPCTSETSTSTEAKEFRDEGVNTRSVSTTDSGINTCHPIMSDSSCQHSVSSISMHSLDRRILCRELSLVNFGTQCISSLANNTTQTSPLRFPSTSSVNSLPIVEAARPDQVEKFRKSAKLKVDVDNIDNNRNSSFKQKSLSPPKNSNYHELANFSLNKSELHNETGNFYENECDFKSISEIANSSTDILSPHSPTYVSAGQPKVLTESGSDLDLKSCHRSRYQQYHQNHKNNSKYAAKANSKIRKSSGKYDTDEAYASELSPQNTNNTFNAHSDEMYPLVQLGKETDKELNLSSGRSSPKNGYHRLKISTTPCQPKSSEKVAKEEPQPAKRVHSPRVPAIDPELDFGHPLTIPNKNIENIIEEDLNQQNGHYCRRCSEEISASEVDEENLQKFRVASKSYTEEDNSEISDSLSDVSSTSSHATEDLDQILSCLEISPTAKQDTDNLIQNNLWEIICRTKIRTEENYEKVTSIVKIISDQDPESLLVETENNDNPLHLAIVQRNYTIIDLILTYYPRNILLQALFKYNINGYCPILISCAMLQTDITDPNKDLKVQVLEKILNYLLPHNLDDLCSKPASISVMNMRAESVSEKQENENSNPNPENPEKNESASKHTSNTENKVPDMAKITALENLKKSLSPTNHIKKTPLILAACYNNLYAVEYLVTLGCDINVTDSLGNTALMLASEKGFYEIVQFLLENGANCELENLQGLTAMNLAVKSGNSRVGILIYKHINSYG